MAPPVIDQQEDSGGLAIATASTTSGDSRLLALPAELRNEIWALAVRNDIPIRVCFKYNESDSSWTVIFQRKPCRSDTYYHNIRQRYIDAAQLLLISHQVREEALPVLYKVNQFCCRDYSVTGDFLKVLETQKMLPYLREVSICNDENIRHYTLFIRDEYCMFHDKMSSHARTLAQRHEVGGLRRDALRIPIRTIDTSPYYSHLPYTTLSVTLAGLDRYVLVKDNGISRHYFRLKEQDRDEVLSK